MQRTILRQKNRIALLGAVLIVLAFTADLGFGQSQIALWALMIASVAGVLPIAIQAYQALRVRVVSIDLLVTIAVSGAFIIRNFEESAIVTFLFLFGSFLEQRTLEKTRSAIRELTEMAPESALKLQSDGTYLEVDVDDVEIGDLLLVKTGDKVPVDGTVMNGEAFLNEASITGEAMLVEKATDSEVYAGTIVENGTIQVAAKRVGEDTTFGKIIELVEEAQDSKSEAERFIDRFAKYYTPAVLLLAAVVYLFSREVELAITILVLGCPGALVIGVPVSNVAGIGNGARNGILLKGSEVIHDFSRVDTMIFDKTGTLTRGEPEVFEKIFYTEAKQEVLSLLASVEHESSHPLAQAIIDDLGEVTLLPVEETDVVRGNGIKATVAGKSVVVGNHNFMQQQEITISDEVLADIIAFEAQGASLVLVAVDTELQLLVAIRDQIRAEVKEELGRIKALGVKELLLLSGDNQGSVDQVAQALGLTEAHGSLLPEDKAAFLIALQQEQKIVAFVGDGVNDSPSLALADIGIAMGSGTDVAIETSDVVLMNSDFAHLSHALGLAKATRRNMRQNIFIALSVVVFLLAALFFSNWMSMSIGMLVHEGSILLVIVNGMRLLRFRLRRRKRNVI